MSLFHSLNVHPDGSIRSARQYDSTLLDRRGVRPFQKVVTRRSAQLNCGELVRPRELQFPLLVWDKFNAWAAASFITPWGEPIAVSALVLRDTAESRRGLASLARMSPLSPHFDKVMLSVHGPAFKLWAETTDIPVASTAQFPVVASAPVVISPAALSYASLVADMETCLAAAYFESERVSAPKSER